MVSNYKLNTARVNELSKFLEQLSPTEVLDILHLFRIQYAQHYKNLSDEIFLKFREMLKALPDSGGIYLILIVDYLGDAILYIGRTSGKSKTSGLKFRIQDHTKLLGKTPLTIFVPNWWIKKVYAIPMDDKTKAKELEEVMWAFLLNNAKKDVRFYSLNELEEKILNLIYSHGLSAASLISVELQTDRKLRIPFMLKCPPAGQPRKLVKVG